MVGVLHLIIVLIVAINILIVLELKKEDVTDAMR